MPTLALAMNVYNEENKLAPALHSAEGVDEIVVADMQSTDTTVAIARAGGARILELPHYGYCEPGRQAVIDACSSDWVLILDADERLSRNGIEELRRLADGAGGDVAAYNIPFRTYVGNEQVRSSGWDAHHEMHPRLFRREAVTWPSHVHAVPVFDGRVVDLPAEGAIWIDHLNFDDYEHAVAKFNRYSTQEAREIVDSRADASAVGGLRNGIAEFLRRYNPEVDGNLSFALSFGMFGYKTMSQLKAVELRGWTSEAVTPAAESMSQAWLAFWSTLTAAELERLEERLSLMPLQARLAALIEFDTIYGPLPAVLAEVARGLLHVGEIQGAIDACTRALTNDPVNPSVFEVLTQIESQLLTRA